jgi:hypothetical protein
MHISFLLSFFVPRAFAQLNLGDIGAPGGPGLQQQFSVGQGISAMWGQICSALICDVGVLLGLPGRVFLFVMSTVAGVSVIMILYGSIRLIASQGNPEGLSSARTTIMYALAGLALALLSIAIVNYVAQFISLATR